MGSDSEFEIQIRRDQVNFEAGRRLIKSPKNNQFEIPEIPTRELNSSDEIIGLDDGDDLFLSELGNILIEEEEQL